MWTKSTDTYAKGGHLSTRTVGSEYDCSLVCLTEFGCLSFDYNMAGRSGGADCWLHSDLKDLQTTYTRRAVNHWTLLEACLTAVPGKWVLDKPFGWSLVGAEFMLKKQL
jgi:hypothetical protein